MSNATCSKRCFASRQAAKAAHQTAGWRMRIYWCRSCKAWHVTNHEKHESRKLPKRYNWWSDKRRREEKRASRKGLRPTG